ncbi:hypothetical protein [Butyrivibrio sp. AE2032]|nr:hypothetical protein [Butyrivibrio sp. AE2032]
MDETYDSDKKKNMEKATVTPLIPLNDPRNEDSLDLIDFMTLLYEREHI